MLFPIIFLSTVGNLGASSLGFLRYLSILAFARFLITSTIFLIGAREYPNITLYFSVK